jgi:transcriptional regulator of acetoin/glycerol metabolism
LRTLMALGEPGRLVRVDDLPPELRIPPPPSPLPVSVEGGVARLEALEQIAMQTALQSCGGNVSEAARRLGVSRSTLYRRLGLAAGEDH